MGRSDPPRKQPSTPPVPMLETDDLLHHPKVRTVIRLKLGDLGIRGSAAEELEGDVVVKCWEDRLKEADPPDSIERWAAYARVRAKGMGIDWLRARETETEVKEKIAAGEPTSETPGSSGREKMDVDRALGEFDKMPKHEHANALFDAVQSGDGPSAASEELGLGTQQAHNIVSSTRKRYIKWLKIAGMAAVLPAGLSAWLLFFRGPAEFHGWRHQGHAQADVTPVHQLAEMQPPALRAKAAQECANQQWDDCQRDLNLAYQKDPAGESAPDVQAMRSAIYEEQSLREMNAKPRYLPTPPQKK